MRSLRSIPTLAFALLAVSGCSGWHAGEPAPETGRSAAPAAREAPRPAVKEEVREAPAERRFTLCALAPHSTAGLRRLEVVRIEGRSDTLALVEGRRLPLSEVVGEVPTAREMAWFSEKKPLTLPIGRRTLRYQIYDVGRVIEAGDLAYLGTVDGLAVYTAAEDFAPAERELKPLLAEDHDLLHLLVKSPALRTQLRTTDVLYVPLNRTGCVFQPLLRMTP